MDIEKIKKIMRWTFVGLTIAYIVTMLIICTMANGKISVVAQAISEESVLQFSTLNDIQKPLATTNIIFFVLLLGVALWLYSQGSKKVLTYLPTAIFTVFTLFCYVALSGSFFSLGNNNPTTSGSYWLMFFIGIFFIVGAITINVIATMAVRNLLKRTHPETEKNNK